MQLRTWSQKSKQRVCRLGFSRGKLLLILGLTILLGVPLAPGHAASLSLPESEMASEMASNIRSLPADIDLNSELIAGRTPFSATFEGEDGTYTTVLSAEPVHYLDEEGSWQPINPAFAASPEGFAVEHNSVQSQVGLRQPWLGVRVGESAVVWEATALGLVADEAFELLAEPLAEGALPEKREEGTILHYAGGWSDPTLVEQIISAPDSVEHALVLDSAPLREYAADYLELQATLDLLPGAAIWANGEQQTAPFATSKRIEVRDEQEQLAFVFNPVVAYEQENRNTAVAGEYLLEPTEEDGQWLVRVRTPYGWWVDPDRQYPAVLDPTIEVLRPDGFGDGMAWINSNINHFVSGSMILGPIDFLPYETRGYLQFNSMPGVIQGMNGQNMVPLQIEKATLEVSPSSLGVPGWKHKKGSYPNWHAIEHKRSTKLYYFPNEYINTNNNPACPPEAKIFSMRDDSLTHPCWTFNHSPDSSDGNFVGEEVLKAGPVNKEIEPKPTPWDVTDQIKEWYTNYYADAPARLGPTFMLEFSDLCPGAAPYNYGQSPWVKKCTVFGFEPKDARLLIEYNKPLLQPGDNVINTPGVPSYLADVFNNETTPHQYDMDTSGLSTWRGVAVRGNHLINDTLPTQVGLRLKGNDFDPKKSTGGTPDQTLFMLMDGHNGAASLDNKPLTAEVISSNLNNFDQDQQRNYRLEYIQASSEIFSSGTWHTISYTLPSNSLLGLIEFPLVDGQTIGVIADGYPGLDIALIEPTGGGSTGDALVGVKNKRINRLKPDGSTLRYLPVINVSSPGQWALSILNQDRPELCPVGEDCDGDYLWREVEIKLLICNDGEIPTARHDCQPVLTPNHSLFTNSYVDLPTLGLKVYSPDFQVIDPIDETTPPLETNDWCTIGVQDGAPVIENKNLADQKYVTVAQGIICYEASTLSLTTSAESGVGLMLPDPSIGLANRGRILPTVIYGNPNIFPVPFNTPDGRTLISFEDPNRLLPYEETGRNIQPFYENWVKGHDAYQHEVDYIDLATMNARGEGQVQTDVIVEAGAAPIAMTWDVSWDLWADLTKKYEFQLNPLQQAPLPQPLDYASANIQFYSAGFNTGPDGLFTQMSSYLTDSGPDAYQFYAPNARLTNDIQLGGATKYIRAVIPPPGQPLQPAADFSCSYNNTTTSCLDLRRPDYDWNNGDEINLLEWELPDITITGEAATVAFASEGHLNIFSSDHPQAAQGVNNINQSFAFETWGVTAKTSQGPCMPGGPNKTIIDGSGFMALPMIGSDGSGPEPHIEVNFTLCDDALRQAQLEFGVVPNPIPVGSTGFGVDVIGGAITVGPKSTRVAMNIGLLTQDRYTVTKGDQVKNGTVTIDTAGFFSMKGSGLIVGKLDADYRLDISWEPLDVLQEGEISYGGGLLVGFMRLHGWFGQGWQNKYSYLPANNDFHFTGTIKATIQIKKGQLIDKKYLKVPWFNTSFSADVSFGEFCSNKNTCLPINWGMSATIKVFGYGVGVYVDKHGPEIFLGSSSKVLVDQCTSCGSLLYNNIPGPANRPSTTDNEPTNLLDFDTTNIPPGAVQPYMFQTFPDPFAGAQQVAGSAACTGFGTSTHSCSFYINTTNHTGRALFSVGWINGQLDVSLVDPNGTTITPENAAEHHVTITPVVSDDGLSRGISFAVNAPTPGTSIPLGSWAMILDGVALDPDPLNYYSLALATDPPPPSVNWTSVLALQETPVNGIMPLTWLAARAGHALDEDVTLDLFYAPVYQPPSWENLSVSFPGSYMDEAGLGSDWDPLGGAIAGDPNQDSIWRIAADIPPGEYSFLVARNGALDEYYGLNGLYHGQEISFTVPISQTGFVKFYYDPRDDFATTDTEHTIVTLVGDMMSEISPSTVANPNWNPENLAGWMKPGINSETFYETTLEIPEGQYLYKIAIDESWAENYGAGGLPGGPDIPLEVPAGGALVRFTFDYASKEINHEILAGTPGQMITRLGDNDAGAYDWPTFSLSDGEYRVGLRIDDHFTGNGQVISWAPGTVLIDDDNVPPPDPVILSTKVKKDAIDVYWQRNDDWLDLSGYLIEYDVPGAEPDTYFMRTKRMVPLPKSFSPFAQHTRLGGLLMSDPTLDIADIVTNICVRSYDVHGNISGCNPVEVIMPIPEEGSDEPLIGPPKLLQTQDGDPLEITWIPPDWGIPAGYLVSYAPAGCLVADDYPPATEGISPIDVGDVLDVFLNGLVQDQSYIISVQAYTAEGVLSEPATVIGKAGILDDSDNNGLPDIWAEIYGIDDPNGDVDEDGLSNFREASLGSNPFNSDSDFDGHYDGAEVAWGTDVCGAEQPPYQAQPKLTLSGPDQLSFTVSSNLPQSDPQEITIFNMGQGDLNWTTLATGGWIQLSQVNGQNLTELQIAVDASGLQWWQQQEYEETLAIRASYPSVQLPNGNIMPAITEEFRIPVKLTLLPPVTGVTQAVHLDTGWNMISSYIDPAEPAVATILADVADDVALVKDGNGAVYWPAYGVDQIGSWDVSRAYQVYVNQEAALYITGTLIDPAQTAINLPAGWNMTAYLRKEPLPIGEALNSLEGSLLLAKDGEGRVYWPELDIDQIGNMLPGQGYQMYMAASDVLNYPDN